MKKILVFALLALMLVSCKKSSTTTTAATNAITATVDGTNYVFNVNANIQSSPADGTHQILKISAFNGSDVNAGGITIGIQSKGAATIKTYLEGGNSDNEFSDVSYASQYSSGNFFSGDNSPANPIVVTVTSISTTSIQGTFHGDIYLGGDITQAKKVLANGTFNVNF